MKRFLLIPLLALTLLTFASCGEEQSSATPAAATVDQAEQDDAPRKAVATRPPKGAETTAPAEDTTAADTTQGTTAQPTTRPDPSKIPADNITSANINPNIGGIQGWVISEMSSLEMTELSVDTGNVTLKKGESTEVGISIAPSNCSNKRLSVTTENSCVKASVKGETLTIVAEKAGSCDITLTSANGLKVGLTVTVVADEEETEMPAPVTEETTGEPAPTEEPTEE